jgi:succinate dehydrogenase / fumarate reductase cytochrome b subunit
MSTPSKPLALLTSTVALKIVVAITGLGMVGFVGFHMAGNLIVFQGREAYNDYAEFMQGLGGLKWAVRFGLLGALGAHVAASLYLKRLNTAARPETYAGLRTKRTMPGAKWMAELGIVLLLFIIYHLAHYTLGWVHADQFDWVDATGRRDLYNHFVLSFQNPVIAVTYLAAMGALAIHLAHGVSSMFKTLGIAHGRWRRPLELAGPAFATLVLVGNSLMPIACLLGWISEA